MNPVGTTLWFVGVVLLWPALASVAAPKRILALYWYNKDHPGNIAFDQSFQTVLQSERAGSVEYYPEYLESDRFSLEDQSRLLHDYLRKKYVDRILDVVIAVGDVPLEFLIKYRDDLFTPTPIVFIAVNRPTAEQLAAGPGMTGIIHSGGYRRTVDLALRLHPDTDQVFIVSGTLDHDKTYETICREEFQGYDDKASINYLTDRPVDDLIFKTKSLPERAIILYIWQQSQNTQGKVLETQDVLAFIADSTSSPIYGVASWQVGAGIVGGYVRTLEHNGTQAAQIALRITKGARARDIPVENAPTVPIFDWRELKRWGISEHLLPSGSVVQFRELSLWDLYRWQIIGVTTLFLVEAFLIGALLAQRGRRALAEKELRESCLRIEDLAGRLIAAQEAERKHIARELHDDLHQQVATLAMGLGVLERQLPDSGHPVRDQLRKLEHKTAKLNDWIRTLSHELHSSVLEHAGLAEALKLHCSSFTEQHGIAVSLDLNCGTESLPSDISLCLYRVVQEGLRNIAKHSGVKRAELRIARNGQSIELSITDQGAGFEPNRLDSQGLGLLSMEERVRLLGGKLEIHSKPGAGTELRVYVPFQGRP